MYYEVSVIRDQSTVCGIVFTQSGKELFFITHPQ